jgi:hypothetical protein
MNQLEWWDYVLGGAAYFFICKQLYTLMIWLNWLV